MSFIALTSRHFVAGKIMQYGWVYICYQRFKLQISDGQHGSYNGNDKVSGPANVANGKMCDWTQGYTTWVIFSGLRSSDCMVQYIPTLSIPVCTLSMQDLKCVLSILCACQCLTIFRPRQSLNSDLTRKEWSILRLKRCFARCTATVVFLMNSYDGAGSKGWFTRTTAGLKRDFVWQNWGELLQSLLCEC